MSIRKILITGASGFIGRNIKESYLSEKYDLITPSSKELDLSDDESVRNYFKISTITRSIHTDCINTFFDNSFYH